MANLKKNRQSRGNISFPLCWIRKPSKAEKTFKNLGTCTLHCNDNSIYVFLFSELRGLRLGYACVTLALRLWDCGHVVSFSGNIFLRIFGIGSLQCISDHFIPTKGPLTVDLGNDEQPGLRSALPTPHAQNRQHSNSKKRRSRLP